MPPRRSEPRLEPGQRALGGVGLALAVVGLCALVGWALWRSGSPAATSSTAPSPPEPRGAVPLRSPEPTTPGETASVRNLATLGDDDDPHRDGWDTEALHLAVSAQLKALAQALRPGGEVDVEALRPLVSADFPPDQFRFGRLEEVQRDAWLLVRRGDSSGGGEAVPGDRPRQAGGATLAGAEAARAAFADWWPGERPSGEAGWEWKVVSVESAPPRLATNLVGEVAFPSAAGRVGLHLRARADWNLGVADEPPRLAALTIDHVEEVVWLGGPEPWFSDAAGAVLGHNACYAAQLTEGQNYWVSRVQKQLGMHFGLHSGLAVGDANGDGLDDLYLCQPGGLPNRLFVMRGDGRADDRSADAGLDWLMPTVSAQFADLDNDGDQDLVVVAVDGRGIWCLENDGQARFTVAAQLRPPQTPTSLALADYDLDGRLDIYVCNYQDGGILAITGTTRPVPFHDATNGGPNILYRNEGAWQFRDVTAEVGLDEHNYRWSYAASWEDYDRDGDSDLYVANDFGRNNLYRNDEGRFRDVAAEAGVEDVASSMSVSWGDYNQDGWCDLYVGNMWSSAGHRVVFQPRFQGHLPEQTRALFQRHAVGNSLYLNQGDGAFRETSDQAGVREGRWAWSSNFVDLDNDGREDLVVANGFLTNDSTHDL